MIGEHAPIVQGILITGSHRKNILGYFYDGFLLSGSHRKNILGYKIDADWFL